MSQPGGSTRRARDIVPVTTRIMRVALSGAQPQKKKGIRMFSLLALVGAFLVCCVYLIIPLMICLHMNDFILSMLIAAFLLTLAEGIVGFVLFRIDSSYEIAVPGTISEERSHVLTSAVSPFVSQSKGKMEIFISESDASSFKNRAALTKKAYTSQENVHQVPVKLEASQQAKREAAALATMKTRVAPVPLQPLLTLPTREPVS